MTNWNNMQTNMEAIAKRNAVRDMVRMAKTLCGKAGYEKVCAALPGKGEVLDDAAYKKFVRTFSDALKASVAVKKDAEQSDQAEKADAE